MTTYTINSLPTTYQKVLTNGVVSTQAKVDSYSENGNVGTSSTDGNSESFVQSVLKSLQSVGVEEASVINANGTPVLSSNANEALQTFLQNLHQALTQSSGVRPASNSDVSEGANFKYTIDFSEAQLGDYLADVEANIRTALDNIGQHISSKAVFNLKVLTKYTDSNTLAEANSSLITTTSEKHGVSIDTSFVSDSIRGVELSPTTPDARLYINLAKIDEMSFSGLPTPNKYDLTSILTHEILHGLAFTGILEGNSTLKTGYDELVTTQNDPPMFVGRHAKTVNSGNPVPLSSANSGQGSAYYHVAIPNDLMSESIKKGEVKSISALDVAMLEDMGIAITGVSPDVAKLQNAYSNPSANLRNLISSIKQNKVLETDFVNLVQSLGGSGSTANLQDFLTQLAVNTENGNSLPNGGLGSLFSVVA